jgi:protocatechuate 3,4-dioxygenase, beta subunit
MTRKHPHWSRRVVLQRGLTLGGALMAAGHGGRTFAQFVGEDGPFIPTPGQILGPAYPVDKPADQDADLTMIKGRPGHAEGHVIRVAGKVMTHAGAPVRGARIELWQANAHGRYTHPADLNPAPLDPNFEGYALLTTDAEGRYSFKTVRPGGYPTTADFPPRPPHIHFDIAGARTRLVTQMYFPGEPHNETDSALTSVDEEQRHLLLATPAASTASVEAGVQLFTWDIVLAMG